MQITLPMFDDFHIHLRNDERMPIATKLLRSGGVRRGIIMPNIAPKAVTNASLFAEYKKSLQEVEPNFDYLGSISLTPNTDEQTIKDAVAAGIMIGKQYPAGVTTNSENGVTDISSMYPIYAVMEEYGLTLSFHGELPKVPLLEAEGAFLPVLRDIVKTFPKLNIVMEHISTAEGIETIKDMPSNVAATITVQHLMLTLQDVIGSKLRPHNFCMPIVKMEKDRQAILGAVKSGNPKFFFGSDSAPHFRHTKECPAGAAGVFTTPIIAQCLAEFFENNDILDRLENFTSKFGADFYGLERNKEMITLTNEHSYTIPKEFNNVVPLFAGKNIKWSLS